MKDVIYWGRPTDVGQAVAALDPPDRTLMLLERVPSTWLTDVERETGLCLRRYDNRTDFDQWERGRLFCEDFELRWERDNDFCQAVYCGAAVDLPGFNREESVRPEVLNRSVQTYDLWGSRVEPSDLQHLGESPDAVVFVELRIPRLLRYPVTTEADRVKRMRLRTVEYHDPGTGDLVYCRFHSLEEVS